VGFIELIEDLPLQLLTCDLTILVFDLRANDFTQLVSRIKTKCLGQLVVDFQLARGCDRLDLDVEGGFLAGKVGCPILGRESNRDHLLVAYLETDQLLFEAGNEPVRADHQLGILVRAAFERLAVDLAEVIDRHLVAIGGLAGLGLECAAVFSHAKHLLLDFFGRNLDNLTDNLTFDMSARSKAGMTS